MTIFPSWFPIKIVPRDQHDLNSKDTRAKHTKGEPRVKSNIIPKDPVPKYEELSIDEICDSVEDLQARLHQAEELCAQANIRFDNYRTQISNLEDSLKKLKEKNTNLQKQLADKNKLGTKSKAKDGPTRAKLRLKQSESDQETLKRTAATREALRHEESVVKNQLEIRKHEDSNNMAVSEEERLDQLALLPCQPFIIMLVDGDSYSVRHCQSA